MSTNNFNSDKEVVRLKAYAENRLAKTPITYERVPVFINLKAKVLEAYKRELYVEWSSAMQIVGREMPFSQQDLNRYIDCLVKLRVDYVNGHRVVIPPVESIVVPSFLSLVLSNLGFARDASYGVELYPELSEEVQIDVEFMRNISRSARLMSHLGIEFSEGYTRSRDGSYEFMSMALIDNYVRTWTKDSHPVYALLASVLALRGIETVLSPRINYGSEDHMISLVRHLASVKG